MSEEYKKQVDLLLKVLPHALKNKEMALKGGTAINLFYRDLKRYSVDIDLCYLPVKSRKDTFDSIYSILINMKKDIEELSNTYIVTLSKELKDFNTSILYIEHDGVKIKVEPNYLIRGALFDPEIIKTGDRTSKEFKREVEVQCQSLADCFGGKLVAALDRQHPRDLFDVMILFENEGITQEIRHSFLTHLMAHNRPIHEILNPRLKDIQEDFEKQFDGMSDEDVKLDDLLIAREKLVLEINQDITEKEKSFLLSFHNKTPNWKNCWDSKIQKFPATIRKLENLGKMTEKNHEKYIKHIKKHFGFKLD